MSLLNVGTSSMTTGAALGYGAAAGSGIGPVVIGAAALVYAGYKIYESVVGNKRTDDYDPSGLYEESYAPVGDLYRKTYNKPPVQKAKEEKVEVTAKPKKKKKREEEAEEEGFTSVYEEIEHMMDDLELKRSNPQPQDLWSEELVNDEDDEEEEDEYVNNFSNSRQNDYEGYKGSARRGEYGYHDAEHLQLRSERADAWSDCALEDEEETDDDDGLYGEDGQRLFADRIEIDPDDERPVYYDAMGMCLYRDEKTGLYYDDEGNNYDICSHTGCFRLINWVEENGDHRSNGHARKDGLWMAYYPEMPEDPDRVYGATAKTLELKPGVQELYKQNPITEADLQEAFDITQHTEAEALEEYEHLSGMLWFYNDHKKIACINDQAKREKYMANPEAGIDYWKNTLDQLEIYRICELKIQQCKRLESILGITDDEDEDDDDYENINLDDLNISLEEGEDDDDDDDEDFPDDDDGF